MGARRVAAELKHRLAQAGLSMREIDRRLAWREGRLGKLLRAGEELKVEDLMAVLRAAGIGERSFFADLYNLEPRRGTVVGGETPVSSGQLSDQDLPDFPPAEEVVHLVHSLVDGGVRRRSHRRRKAPEVGSHPLDETDLPRRRGELSSRLRSGLDKDPPRD